MHRFPAFFLRRYNRFTEAVALSATKFLLFTNYTYVTLDLTVDLAENPDKGI